LKHLDLAHRRFLLELAEGPTERDHLGVAALPLRSDSLEAALMVHVTGEDLLALSSIHGRDIGREAHPL
jgi:hypothetical protein